MCPPPLPKCITINQPPRACHSHNWFTSAGVAERDPFLKWPLVWSHVRHEILHCDHLVVLSQWLDLEIGVERDLDGARLAVPVLYPCGQHQRTVEPAGECQGAQKVVGLVAEST